MALASLGPRVPELRKVDSSARAQFRNRRVRTGKAFRNRYVAFAPTTEPDVFHIYYRHHRIRTIDLSTMSPNARRPSTRS